jgi:hypothetical protein
MGTFFTAKIIDFRRPSPQVFDEYNTFQEVDYSNQWQNQHQRISAPSDDTERHPSPFYNNSAPVSTRPQVPISPNEFQQTPGYSREPPRQPVVPPHSRVNPIIASHPATISHHPVVVRDQLYRPQFQPSQFPEYANGYQAPFIPGTFVGHPGVQHMNPNVRRHDDTLRNLRSPLLEEFRSSKNKKFELKV